VTADEAAAKAALHLYHAEGAATRCQHVIFDKEIALAHEYNTLAHTLACLEAEDEPF
jgi:hypothetical protein